MVVVIISVAILSFAPIIDLSQENWDRIISPFQNVFIHFYTSNCDSCKNMKKLFSELSIQSSNNCIMAQMECTRNDQNAKICERYRIQEYKRYPLLKMVKGGFPIDYSGKYTTKDMLHYISSVDPPCSVVLKNYCSEEELSAIEKAFSIDFRYRLQKLQYLRLDVTRAEQSHKNYATELQSSNEDSLLKFQKYEESFEKFKKVVKESQKLIYFLEQIIMFNMTSNMTSNHPNDLSSDDNHREENVKKITRHSHHPHESDKEEL